MLIKCIPKTKASFRIQFLDMTWKLRESWEKACARNKESQDFFFGGGGGGGGVCWGNKTKISKSIKPLLGVQHVISHQWHHTSPAMKFSTSETSTHYR